MMPAIEMTGRRYGSLTVINRSHAGRNKRIYWCCRCDCGQLITKCGTALRRGQTKTCGRHHQPFTHGASRRGKKTSEYMIWGSMRQRCHNPKDKSYHRYGGRGIVVCERWEKFESFLADMGVRPSSRHSIERIDNDGNYEPGNCRWATYTEQASNTRRNRYVIVHGERLPLLHAIRRMCAGEWA